MNLLNNIKYFIPQYTGVTLMGQNNSPQGEGPAFAFDAGSFFESSEELGVVLYTEKGEVRIPFSKKFSMGTVLGLSINDKSVLNYTYSFYADDEILADERAICFDDTFSFGDVKNIGFKKCKFNVSSFDWENDTTLKIPFEKSILYGLNVRAFTNDRNSKVHKKGTFEGVAEKANYLKELGITSVVLMPSYEFDECEFAKLNKMPQKDINDTLKTAFIDQNEEPLLNCWGFTAGYYYAPKASYAYSNNPTNSFKLMVKTLHRNGIEVMMHFYFPAEFEYFKITDILKYWVREYHVDGFRISGFNIPFDMIIKDPFLKDTKLWFPYLSDEIKNSLSQTNKKQNILIENGNIRYDLRRFLKGDEGLLNSFINYQKNNPINYSVVNYICDYDGFSLYDLYSYERKHNEENREKNADGNNINYSWNCGIEGETRKKSIISLRKQQIKNAIALLMLCQGVPYIFSGDEFGNTRFGNNNAYCHDNDIWNIKWKNTNLSDELYKFTKFMISLRRENGIFRLNSPIKNQDYKNMGFPDISYHGIEAWRPDLGYNSRMLGIYLNGRYSNENSKSFFIGINMHWENHRLAVPKLKNNEKYRKIADTSDFEGISKGNEIPIGKRSIVIYEA